ncbi:MAG: glycosyltransferase [Planctomycetota bacterium]|jgi:glycosyltransferase involved in cell wall biosynthesis
MARTTIVIPCHNEAARLDLEAFKAYMRRPHGVEFIFVDDGSTDGTRRLLQQLQEETGHSIQLLALPRNLGKAEAVRHGFLNAFERAPDYVGFWDGDLATPLEAIDEFLELLDARPDLEMVFGSRVNLLGRQVHRNLMRHYVGRVFATAVNVALRLPIYDTQCGAKMFRVSDEMVQVFREPFLSKWIFDVEIIARLIRSRRGTDRPSVRNIICEHPLQVWRDVKGSKIRLRDFAIVALDLTRIWFRYMLI